MTNEFVKWFGDSWDANICDPQHKIDIPLDAKCCWCDEGFDAESQGVRIVSYGSDTPYAFYHVCCFLRSTIGSLGHLQKKCSCFGGNEEDPPEMTKREAAVAATRYFALENRFETKIV